jgi:glutathione S-transferase
MRLYNSIGPNPRAVRIFMAERGIELPKIEVDIRGGENRQGPYLSKNPSGQCPALELDDGSVITEITAICEYLDEVAPGSSLIGTSPQQRAETRMWARRIDLNILEPMANGFRFGEGLKMFENRVHCIPHAAADLKATAQELADILLFAFLDFFSGVGQEINPALKNITAWHARMKARPSANA